MFALVKGRSSTPDMDFIANAVHLLLFHLHCIMYFEFVPSKSNWADEISRRGLQGQWHQQHGFRACLLHVPWEISHLSTVTLLRVFSFL